jgi:iduronate 2-sulfatase
MSGIIGSVSHYNFGRKGIDSSAMDKKWAWYENEVLSNSKTFMEFYRSKCYLVIGTGKLNHDEVYHPAEGPWPAEGQWDYYWAKADYGPSAWDGSALKPHPFMPQSMSDEFDSYIDFNWARMSEVPFTEVAGYWEKGKYKGGGWKYAKQSFGRPTGMYQFTSTSDRMPLPDEYNADWTIEMLKKLDAENTGQPFLLMVGFVRPHTPMYCPDEYFDMFPLDTIEMPPTVGVNFEGSHYDDVSMVDTLLGYRLYRSLAKAYDKPGDGFRRWYQAYYACVAFVDDQVGKVVNYLEGSPFWDNTIVGFFADNGWNNGPKQYVFKNGPWEDGTKVPLIIRAPGAQKEGHVSDELVNLLDVYPTLLALTGFDPAVDTIKDASKGAPLSGKPLTTALAGESSSDFD